MEKRTLGKTGIEVTPLGFGAAQIGYFGVSLDEAAKILNGALDAGINVIDTAACYGNSEELIGGAVAGRRDDYVLVSKCGHHVEEGDGPAWDPGLIRSSVERSLRRLRTDHLDAILLHSCDAEHLNNDAMIEALQKLKSDGLTRAIGYSGENEAAQKAVAMGVFDCIETSVSFCDQQVLEKWLPAAREAGLGVFAKRPIANTAWRDLSHLGFYQGYAKTYAERLAKMGFTPESLGFDGDWIELALRFSAWQPGVSTILVGSSTPGHLEANIEAVGKGPLPERIVTKIREAWAANDDGGWDGQI